MIWSEAISKSVKGTATRRVTKKNGTKHTFIRYSDTSGYLLVSKDGKVDWDSSRPATSKELDGYTDWEPSK